MSPSQWICQRHPSPSTTTIILGPPVTASSQDSEMLGALPHTKPDAVDSAPAPTSVRLLRLPVPT